MGKHRSKLRLTLILCVWLLPAACSQSQKGLSFAYPPSLEEVLRDVGARFEKNNPSIRIIHRPLADSDALSLLTRESGDFQLLALAEPALFAKIGTRAGIQEVALLAGDEVVLASSQRDLWRRSSDRQRWTEDWMTELFQGEHSFVAADPELDSLGHQTRLCLKLAEIHYNRQGLYQRFLLRSAALPDLSAREVVSALEGGRFDLAFIYRSTALQRDLKHLRLAPEVSLGSTSHADLYARVLEVLRIQTGAPGPETLAGKPIRYGLALLEPASASARDFYEYVLSPEAQNLFRAKGFREEPFERFDPLRFNQ